MTTTRVATFLMVSACLPVGGTAAADSPADNPRRTPVVEAFEKTHGAVVNISSTKVVEINRSRSPLDFFFQDFDRFLGPRTRRYKSTSVGSGFVIHKNGYIVTNAHVVDRTTDVKITFDDQTSYDAEVVAEDRAHDLALLKIEPKSPLPVLQFGDSSDLMIGETVIAIGNPLGYQHTLTTGVISATDRDLKLTSARTGQPVVYANLIQTDAGINPGNSGGPLLNVLGQLIGINTAIRSDAQNIGFAIPINTLKRLLPVMIREQQKNQFSLGLSVDHHRRVTRVLEDSPASRAGLRVGDTVTAVNGERVESDFDFYMQLLDHQPGQIVSLETRRSGSPRTARIRLQEPPRPDGAKLATQRLGITLSPLSRVDARRLRLQSNAGLMIDDAERGGPAQREGIAAGDILTALGGYYVKDLDEVGSILDQAQAGDQIYVRILRLEQGKLHRYYTYVTLR
ncbi:MAG: trypsin-like peptidase domain-containing protein [Planctomycetes bacterium]|nr:trypsin-like peptidase domain-containing protein [Planctomycetota bacterium]